MKNEFIKILNENYIKSNKMLYISFYLFIQFIHLIDYLNLHHPHVAFMPLIHKLLLLPLISYYLLIVIILISF